MDFIQKILAKEQIHYHTNQGIIIVNVSDTEQGNEAAFKLLIQLLNPKTLLFLSGGMTPKILYESLAQSDLHIGAVGMIDERFGNKLHANSNELMIKNTGLLRILSLLQIPFYPILGKDVSMEEAGDNYDQKIRELFASYPRSIGILGIGSDGHTAGILARNSKFKIPASTAKRGEQNSKFESEFITSYKLEQGEFKERITMTFLGLSMLDIFIILAFGKDKKSALKQMFNVGSASNQSSRDKSEEEIPARFYLRPDIAKKTILVTDQY